MKKIAIWGDYGHGNYGDDIMAVMFALELKNNGYDPIVYNLDSYISGKYQISTTSSLDVLIRDASICVIGGGGLLVGDNYIRILAKKHAFLFEYSFYLLEKALKKYDCPCFALSIGGNGNGSKTHLPYFRKRFWKNGNCKFATVRLKEDISLLSTLNVKVEYIPDVLLSIPFMFNVKKTDNTKHDRVKVGLNLIEKDCKKLIEKSIEVARLRPSTDFYFIKSHLDGYKTTYEALPPTFDLPNLHHFKYDDPINMINFISSLDILISSKLHLGVTALSLGVPFYSYQGKLKTRSFLRSIDSNFASQADDSPEKIMSLIKSHDNIYDYSKQFNDIKLKDDMQKSRTHFKILLSNI